MARDAIYHLLNSIVVPRPIGWISTRSATGVPNVAPHSYCMIVSADPAIIAFSSSGAKDTLANIRATGEFVFNHVSGELAEAMNLSSANFPPEESEFDWTGLTPVPSTVVGAPRVGESPAALECRLRDIQGFGNGPSYLIIGDVVHIALNPALITDGILDNRRTQPVGRLARSGYVRSTTFFDLPRPTYRGLLEAGMQPKRRPQS
jgi:flavin reductase (DIM6/NTAB) family NADH-FMN oxidoreductase RutF